MSKMNQLSIEEQETAYDEYVESQRQELRLEGATELRLAILHDLVRLRVSAKFSPEVADAYNAAISIVERAFI